jgi:hypothetical protein
MIRYFYKRKSISEDKELAELVSLLSSMSWVRHAVLSYFQRFKLENLELIKKELEKDPPSSPNTMSPTGA